MPQMTIEEIKQRFDGEWVLLDKPESSSETAQLQSGTLVYHSPNRQEVYRKAMELPVPRHIAIFYVGRPPEGMRYLL
jgi:hypothetical protein